MSPQHITIKQFSEIYGPKKTKSYELIHAGAIEAIKVGSRTYVTVESAERWRASLPAFKPSCRQGAVSPRGPR